jgi:hypothetical protein
MFRFTRKPSSGSHNRYLAKNTGLFQCRYRRRTDVVSVMAAYYAEGTTEKKSPVTPPGIDPGTVLLVAQRLNHYATPGPSSSRYFS